MTWHAFYLRYYRRYLGWLPVQFCMICGKAYWGGLPTWWIVEGRVRCTWMASWKDYCSLHCCNRDDGGWLDPNRLHPPG